MKSRSWLLLALGGALLWGQQPQHGPKPPATTQTVTEPSRSPAVDRTRGGVESPALPALTLPEGEYPAFSNYQAGAEDLLSVTVMDSPEFTRQVRVSGAGTIKLPLMKREIAAAGKTCAELEQTIARALVEEGLLREPSVSVTLREFYSKPVTVSGAVRAPVVFQAVRPLTLVEALSRAGGLGENAGPELLVLAPERDGRPAHVVRVSIKSLLDTPDSSSNIWLRGGEEVRVPMAGRVYVLGGVSKPGAVLITSEEPATLLRVLALAGGTTPTAASKAFLLRSSSGSPEKQQIAVNLKKLLKRQDPDVLLQTNDVIFVPESNAKKITQTTITTGLTSLIYSSALLLWR